MKEDILKIKNDIESYLKDSMEHQDKQIEYIIRNPEDNNVFVLASDGADEAIEFKIKDNKFNNEFSYVPEWDFNFDYYIYNYLEDGYKVEYMSPNTHYGIWNSIHELYPEDIEFKDGVQSYLQYCVDNRITKAFIDKETGLNTPEVLNLFNGLAKGTYMEYKGYIALSTELNFDNENEVLVNIYKSMQDFIDGDSLETISLNEVNLKDNVREYIDGIFIDEKAVESEKQYFTFVLGYDLLNDMLSKSSTPENDISYDFCNMIADKFIQSDEYRNEKYSAYDMLSKWVEDNKDYIKCEHSLFTGQELDNGIKVLEIGFRRDEPIALVSKKVDDKLEYIIAFNYEIKDNKMEWGYGYYYDEFKDVAKKNFDKVISGGNLSKNHDERSR